MIIIKVSCTKCPSTMILRLQNFRNETTNIILNWFFFLLDVGSHVLQSHASPLEFIINLLKYINFRFLFYK